MFLSLIQSVSHAVLLGFLSSMPLMVAALGLGVAAAALAGLVAATACGVVGGLPFGVSFFGIAALPAILIAKWALGSTKGPQETVRWYPVGGVLARLTVVMTGMLLLWIAALPDHDGGVRGWLEEFLSQALDMLGDQVDPRERTELTHVLSATLPAMLAGVWLLMAAVNAVIAQTILARLGQSLRPSPDYVGLELPDWLVGLPLGAALVWVGTSGNTAYVAANVVVIGLIPFSGLGVALIHGWLARRQQAKAMGFVAFYGTLMMFSVWALVPLALVGLVRFIRSWIIRRYADRTEG